ncbi:MAG: flagellar biosynthetic protein FliR [Chlamydiia bacterium]|nr:flagellar biosynthetic protein FliR [Chlamydiia bacterium]
MTDSYALFFINSALAEGDPTAPLTLLLLFLGRILPIIAQAPFFGARVLPHPVKVAFGLSLFVIFLPHLLIVTKTPMVFSPITVLYLIKEMVIGIFMGFLIAIPFMIVQMTGMYIDHQRGGASLQVNDPTIQNQSSPMGTLLNMVMIVVFYMIDGPFLFLETIHRSFEIIPPDRFFNMEFFTQNSFWETIIGTLGYAVRIAVQLAGPALIAILMSDVFLGIANRLAPQVQITFLGIALKSFIGLFIFTLGWSLLNKEAVRQTYIWMREIENMLLTIRNLFQIYS